MNGMSLFEGFQNQQNVKGEEKHTMTLDLLNNVAIEDEFVCLSCGILVNITVLGALLICPRCDGIIWYRPKKGEITNERISARVKKVAKN